MRSRRAATVRDLRTAIECLPRHTREAMLAGVRANPIIVGAYTHDGGICPMLAAHRAGGRTDCIAFARAWDRFALGPARAAKARQARRATERELRVLISHLEASLLDEDAPPASELARAAAEHRTLRERRLEQERRQQSERAARSDPVAPRPGDPDRAPELRHRAGWAWLRPTRRLDEYERALAWVHAQGDDPEAVDRPLVSV